MSEVNDFEIEVVVRNGHIMRRLVELGWLHGGRPSVTQLIDKMDYGFNSYKPRRERGAGELEIRNLVGLKVRPTDDKGQWKPMVTHMAKTLDIEPEKLFPGVLKTRVPLKTWLILTSKIGQPLDLTIMD